MTPVDSPPRRPLAERYLGALLAHRAPVAAVLAAATVVFAVFATRTRIHTDFFDLYPPRHPYIELYEQYREMFGGANVLTVAVERIDGDVYRPETIAKIDRITRYLLDTPGVDPTQVVSLTSPRLKHVRATGWGIEIRPVVPGGTAETPEELARVREVVRTTPGIRGFHVSSDDRAAAVFAGFWEEGTDLGLLFERMSALETRESDEHHRIHVTGYPMLFAWIAHHLPATLLVLGVTVAAIALLLFLYFRTAAGVWVPLASAALSAVWGVGFAGMAGLDLDPLSLVVLVLISARALSHSVQSVERYHDELARLKDPRRAIEASYTALFTPAVASIAADGLAVLTLATASIGLIQGIAYVGSFWVASIFASVVTLHPIVLSALPPPAPDPRRGGRLSDRAYARASRALVRLSSGRSRYAVLAVTAAAVAGGIHLGGSLRVGDATIGKALLGDDHPYNRAFDFVNRSFVGTAQLVIVAEGKREGAIRSHEVLRQLDAFAKHMEADPEAGGSLTITEMIRQLFRAYHEGEPRWLVVPRDPKHLGQMFFLLESGTAPGEMDRFVGPGYRDAAITVVYRGYSNEVLERSIARAEAFIAANPSEHVRYRLAGGLVGILAAANQEIEWSYRFNLRLVLVTVFVLSLVFYRSAAAALIVMSPSLAAVPLTEAAMYLCGIDVNVNSLPVAAVGIGIGIDYGYYVLSRILEELRVTGDFDRANERALLGTGRAILFTATTLTASVVFWIFFPMRFQAEMALLLAMVLAFHVAGALVLVPTLVSLLRPRFAEASRAAS